MDTLIFLDKYEKKIKKIKKTYPKKFYQQMDPLHFLALFCYDHRPKQKKVVWTSEEKLGFYNGLLKHGRGKWKEIQEEFVPTKTHTDIYNYHRGFSKSNLSSQPRERLIKKKEVVWHENSFNKKPLN
jgi:hypothetical protein